MIMMSATTSLPKLETVFPQEQIPRRMWGCIFSSSGRVLARSADSKVLLVWRGGGPAWGGSMSGTYHNPSALCLYRVNASGDVQNGDKELHSGGRLTSSILGRYAAAIDEWFGCRIADELDIGSTLVTRS
jgi:hypothetical protein